MVTLKGVIKMRKFLVVFPVIFALIGSLSICAETKKEEKKEEKKEVKKSDKMTFIEFVVEGNSKCDRVEPVIKELRNEYANAMYFKIIDVFKDRKFWDDYGLKEVPTMVILDLDGKEVYRLVGVYWKKEDMVQVFSAKGIKKESAGPLKNVRVIGDKFYKGKSKVTLLGLPAGYLSINVYDAGGNEVTFIKNVGGQFIWDLKDYDGRYVDVGDYTIIVKDAKDYTKELKIKVEIEKKEKVFKD